MSVILMGSERKIYSGIQNSLNFFKSLRIQRGFFFDNIIRRFGRLNIRNFFNCKTFFNHKGHGKGINVIYY